MNNYVFPVNEKKQPLCKWREESSLESTLEKEYKYQAIDCGKSNLVVIDLDPPNGLQNWVELTKKYDIGDDTYVVQTPREGLHYYFKYAGGDLRNSTGKLGDGIDVRAEGGYVVAPPTPDYHILVDREPIELPEALKTLLAKREEFLPDEEFKQGSRHDSLVRKAGEVWNVNPDADILYSVLLEVNKRQCKPPLPESEVKSIAYSTKMWESKASKPEVIYKSIGVIRKEEAEPLEPMVAGLFKEKSLVLFSGPGGSGKSYITLELAHYISVGAAWNHLDVKQTPVLIIDLENGQQRINARVKELLYLPEGPVYFKTKQKYLLDDQGSVEELIKDIEATKAGLIILDSLVDFIGGYDENSNGDMAKVWERLRQVRETTGVSILAIHHVAKSSAGTKYQSGRGASALKDNCDCSIQVIWDKDKDVSEITLKHDKYRDGPEMDIKIEPKWEDGTFRTQLVSYERVSHKDDKLEKAKAVFGDDYTPANKAVEELMQNLGCSQKTAYRWITRLLEKGLIEPSEITGEKGLKYYKLT